MSEENNGLELNLLYVHATTIGYARLGTKLAAALTRSGVDVYDSLEEDASRFVPHHTRGSREKICNTVAWVSTPGHARGWHDGQTKCLFTMWEASTLPEPFRENLHEFEYLMVPSQHNLELFSRYHDNVVKIPLGVDTAEWKPVDRKTPEARFNFLIGGSGKRKGTDLAYRAFKKVFKTWPKDMPTPYLIMKSPKPEDYYGERIERVGGQLTDLAERELYAMSHCYLQPSRGEGWGLQPLQAMATGMPTILTNAHGQAEFANYAVPINKFAMQKSDYFVYGDAGDWWEPDFDELCERMEDVYLNYAKFALYAENVARSIIPVMYSWDTVARAFTEVLGESMSQPYSGTGAWVDSTTKLYLTRVTQPWNADIAGILYHFLPNTDYYEPSDVKRILFEANLLDPSCIVKNPSGPLTEIETGLAGEQLERLGAYSASMSYCPTCHQKLNTGELADL